MQPYKTMYNYTWSSYFSDKNQTTITHTQGGNVHIVRKYKNDCTEVYSVSGKDAFNKARKAFKKWIDIEIG